jgi:Circularly permutated YpsA SLOG family
MRKLRKVVSGGQTGVDQAALRAARDCRLQIGGWCPPGRECETGMIPPEFPLQESEQERSPNAPDIPRSQRTEWNVRDSDGTLVIHGIGASHSEAATEDTGTKWAIECAARLEKPLLVCQVDDPNAQQRIVEWVASDAIATLNVAGPSESNAPGIGEKAYALLMPIFTRTESRANERE